MSWNERSKSELPLLNDSGSDLFRNLLPIGSCQCQLSFRRIGKKPAFNENRRQPALAKHVIFGRAGPTVLGICARMSGFLLVHREDESLREKTRFPLANQSFFEMKSDFLKAMISES